MYIPTPDQSKYPRNVAPEKSTSAANWKDVQSFNEKTLGIPLGKTHENIHEKPNESEICTIVVVVVVVTTITTITTTVIVDQPQRNS